METTELIKKLYQHHEDYGDGKTQNFFDICCDCKEAAERLAYLQRFIDDILGDHYIDYLDFYTARCNELEDKLQSEKNAAIKDINELVLNSEDICEYCKNYIPCNGKDCEHYIDGVGMKDESGNQYDLEWSCMDFNYGECSKLENTPCNGCMDCNFGHFKWRGLADEQER